MKADGNMREVEWYKRNGKYPLQRIARCSDGAPYVVGDWSWNRLHPEKHELIETIPEFKACWEL
jgi:hypothetical protein